uniref:STAS domain-containing protein n=1 Tax=Leersia perrieri TaxID=77586 RepID=A0A0D9V2I3_9ORYZ
MAAVAPENDHEHHRRVNLLPAAGRRPLGAAVRAGLKDTFFPDDPFRGLGALPPARRAWRVVRYFVPALDWGAEYSLGSFWYDLLAGVTIASLSIPQGISYATLASIPPVIGLYSCFVPPLVYAVMGSSRNLGVGPVATSSLLVASIIGGKVKASDDPQLYTQLVFTSAFFTGVLQAALGFLRLGILVDFMSRPAITGFMGGTAIVIMLQQLKGLLGMKHFTTKTDVVSVLRYVFHNTHQWQWQSTVLGVCFLIFLVFTEQVRRRRPKLFWVSAMSPLLVVIVGCVFSFLIKGDKHGIPIVGTLKRGINPSSISQLKFQSEYVGVAMKAGFVSGMLALAEGVAVGRSFAAMKNERIDGNKEMVAFGLMNLIGSFTSCYITTGAFSKTAVNYHAGCRTAMSNAVMSACMALVLLALAPLFRHTPLVALSAIITASMLGLVKHRELRRLYAVDKADFAVAAAALLGVVFHTMITGLALAVAVSLLRALLHVARPPTSKLALVPSVSGAADDASFRDVAQYPSAAAAEPGVLVLQIGGSAVCFANAEYLRERIARWVDDEAAAGEDDLVYVVLDMGGVTAIDTPGIEMLREVHGRLEKKGVKMAMTNPRIEVAEKLVLSGFVEVIGESWMFVSNGDAVAACRYTLQGSKHGGVPPV